MLRVVALRAVWPPAGGACAGDGNKCWGLGCWGLGDRGAGPAAEPLRHGRETSALALSTANSGTAGGAGRRPGQQKAACTASLLPLGGLREAWACCTAFAHLDMYSLRHRAASLAAALSCLQAWAATSRSSGLSCASTFVSSISLSSSRGQRGSASERSAPGVSPVRPSSSCRGSAPQAPPSEAPVGGCCCHFCCGLLLICCRTSHGCVCPMLLQRGWPSPAAGWRASRWRLAGGGAVRSGGACWAPRSFVTSCTCTGGVFSKRHVGEGARRGFAQHF